MKYVDEFRNGKAARGLAATITDEVQPGRSYRLMEFCGGHTHAVARHGIPDLLPDVIELIHGPGCPVCVLPVGRLDMAINLARCPGTMLCTYGDMLRVPGSGGTSLLKAKAEGADIRMVYSTIDALRLARDNPDTEVVFFAIGFETTTPPTAVALKQAKDGGIGNFSVLCNHVVTPAPMNCILGSPDGHNLDGIIGPSHVSTVIGWKPYAPIAKAHHKPVVIAGFEPLDVMQSVLMLVRQINAGRAEVENQYTRAVVADGNRKAQDLMAEVFTMRPSFEWRGLGELPDSALALSDAYADFDAEKRFELKEVFAPDNPACECAAIVSGVKTPTECKIFGTVCTPDTPVGACMVSSEGACAAHYVYGRFRDHEKQKQTA